MTHLSVIDGGRCDLLDRIQAAWPTVVGEAVAVRARPIAEDRRVVTINCDDQILARELEVMAHTISKRLEPVAGFLVRLRFEASR